MRTMSDHVPMDRIQTPVDLMDPRSPFGKRRKPRAPWALGGWVLSCMQFPLMSRVGTAPPEVPHCYFNPIRPILRAPQTVCC